MKLCHAVDSFYMSVPIVILTSRKLNVPFSLRFVVSLDYMWSVVRGHPTIDGQYEASLSPRLSLPALDHDANHYPFVTLPKIYCLTCMASLVSVILNPSGFTKIACQVGIVSCVYSTLTLSLTTKDWSWITPKSVSIQYPSMRSSPR